MDLNILYITYDPETSNYVEYIELHGIYKIY